MKKKYILILIIIFILSIATHFAFFGHPDSCVFDEVHFGKFVSGYLDHKYFFDIHPPLGKLLISLIAWLGGFKTGFAFQNIADVYPDKSYIWLRLLPVLAGTLLPVVIFYLARALKFTLIASATAALLIVFENALLGQSLFILLDSTLLLFGFLGVLFYLVAKRKKSIWLYALAFVSLAFAFSIKWTGLGFIALIIGTEIFDFIEHRLTHTPNEKVWPRIIIMIFLPIIIYFYIFAIHFALLPRSGEGDRFHSQEFQKSLIGNQYKNDSEVKTANIVSKFVELNIEMFRANQRIVNNHFYASKWYTWPMMARPIYYWNKTDETNQTKAKIYLFGNPIIFWVSFLGFVTLVLECFFFPDIFRKNYRPILFILFGFLINLVPFALIKRPMFLYHYFPSLIFNILILCFTIDLIKNLRLKKIIFAILLISALISFIFYSPLTYGLNLHETGFKIRLWPNNWR